jgi:hypothetical protein
VMIIGFSMGNTNILPPSGWEVSLFSLLIIFSFTSKKKIWTNYCSENNTILQVFKDLFSKFFCHFIFQV